MKKFLVTVNFSCVFCFLYVLTGTAFPSDASFSSDLNDDFVIEKVFFHHEKVEDLSVVCHIPVEASAIKANELVLSSLSLSKVECEALKDEAHKMLQEESVGWHGQNSAQTLSEI